MIFGRVRLKNKKIKRVFRVVATCDMAKTINYTQVKVEIKDKQKESVYSLWL